MEDLKKTVDTVKHLFSLSKKTNKTYHKKPNKKAVETRTKIEDFDDKKRYGKWDALEDA